MPASADIYGQIQPFKTSNPLADMAQVMQIKGSMNQDALNQYTLSSAQRKDDETNKLAALLRTPGFDLSTPDGQRQAYSVAPTVTPGYIKTQLDAKKTQSDIGKSDADAGKARMDTHARQVELSGQAFGALRANPTPENFAATIDHLVTNQILPPDQAAQIKAQAVANPQAIPMIAEQGFRAALSAKDQLPKFEKFDTGGSVQTGAVDPVTGKATITGSLAKTQSPDSIASNATSRANNRDTISAENMRAGVSADGSVSPDVEAQAQAIAKGQLLPPSGAALINPKNARVLARVMEINPSYDATTVLAKKKAANDFTTGNQGNSMRSFAVAGQHLDQLGQLVDALDNGNMPLVNKLGNLYSQQTGSPAVTNFDAAKDVVSKEVVKAIVAGGGGVAEREELSRLMDNAKSPAQLKGVIKQYRNLMAAQHDALLAQRRASGLPDSTLPNYTDANGSDNGGAVPADIAAILAKHGGK